MNLLLVVMPLICGTRISLFSLANFFFDFTHLVQEKCDLFKFLANDNISQNFTAPITINANSQYRNSENLRKSGHVCSHYKFEYIFFIASE